MQSYGSLHSPSLRKMENSRAYGAGPRKRYNYKNMIGDPFFMVTISISIIGWLISLGSGAAIASRANSTGQTEFAFPQFGWWTLAYMLLLNIGVSVVVATNATQTYHIALVGYSAAGIALASASVNNLIYSSDDKRVAAAVGFIFMCMSLVLWTFYFGAAPSATPRAFIDSFALSPDTPTGHHQQPMNGYGVSTRPETSTSVQPPQMYTSAQLNGFENPSPVGGISVARNSTPQPPFASSPPQKPSATPTIPPDTEVVPPTEYPYRAKAIYSYEANPEDANEISFTKHEVLEVSDVSGRWWQARKENGETGIAPSNYLILL